MRLRDLFSDDAKIDPQAEAAVVTGLAVDSRAVKPGDLFFALAGSKTDGARFIDAAVASGAVAVAGDHPPQGGRRVPFVTTPNPRRALALAAAKFYPRQPATIAAVTGTSGKTSVAAFARQIWLSLGHASASIGTIGLVSPKRTIYGSLTTPDPIALHRQLDEIAEQPQLGGEIMRDVRMVIHVIARQVGESAGTDADTVQSILIEPVRRSLECEMRDAFG